jgi:general secretion pathway protein D
MVTDLPQKMDEIRNMVREFDEASRQVLIETDIWELSLTDRFQRGIDWETIFRSVKDLDFKGRFPLGLVDTATATATRQQISVGTVEHDDYIATIQFLSTYGKTEILSRPHLAVLNNEEAKILIGSKEAYITTTLSQAESSTTTSESVSFIDVGVKLNVVPTISKDGFITMKIKPEVSSVRETLKTTQGSVVPIVETSEVETTVKVKDGNTIMIAGLIKQTQTETTTGVPGLSKIPILKWFFSKYERGPSSGPVKKELIICITPRIITGEAPEGITKQ